MLNLKILFYLRRFFLFININNGNSFNRNNFLEKERWNFKQKKSLGNIWAEIFILKVKWHFGFFPIVGYSYKCVICDNFNYYEFLHLIIYYIVYLWVPWNYVDPLFLEFVSIFTLFITDKNVFFILIKKVSLKRIQYKHY